MTAKDREEIARIIREALTEVQSVKKCELGIKPETAHELISFADTWKTCRRYMIGGIITVAIGGLLAAIWAGIKQILKE